MIPNNELEPTRRNATGIRPGQYLCGNRRAFTTASAECIWGEAPGQFVSKSRGTGDRIASEVLWDHEGRAMFWGDNDLEHFSSEVERELQDLLSEGAVGR